MVVTYRDALGMVSVRIDFDSVEFVDGECIFESNKRLYRIPVANLVNIAWN